MLKITWCVLVFVAINSISADHSLDDDLFDVGDGAGLDKSFHPLTSSVERDRYRNSALAKNQWPKVKVSSSSAHADTQCCRGDHDFIAAKQFRVDSSDSSEEQHDFIGVKKFGPVDEKKHELREQHDFIGVNKFGPLHEKKHELREQHDFIGVKNFGPVDEKKHELREQHDFIGVKKFGPVHEKKHGLRPDDQFKIVRQGHHTQPFTETYLLFDAQARRSR
ncbi:uncharacterized protein LOC126378186 isoform X3 [Pectinophora gossypiella]|uniref:uncharacterized protein LOC126378186 isoform X3 n=1 Tax=Pectinophora gossypiella TaxID=13191 RepID=UPI00214E8DDC|nr:uncharacterized protein LOC126378186 isoform X3 [Pectinophora gossypiella]